jgi:hypothetical protein
MKCEFSWEGYTYATSLGSGLIKSTMRARRRGRLRPDSARQSVVSSGDAPEVFQPVKRTLSGEELARCRTLRLGPFPVPPHKNCS